MVLEARSVKWRCGRVMFPLQPVGKESFLPHPCVLRLAFSPRYLLTCSCITPVSTSVVTWSSALYLFLLRDISHIGLMTHLTLAWPHFNYICSNSVFSQVRVRSSSYLFERYNAILTILYCFKVSQICWSSTSKGITQNTLVFEGWP